MCFVVAYNEGHPWQKHRTVLHAITCLPGAPVIAMPCPELIPVIPAATDCAPPAASCAAAEHTTSIQ